MCYIIRGVTEYSEGTLLAFVGFRARRRPAMPLAAPFAGHAQGLAGQAIPATARTAWNAGGALLLHRVGIFRARAYETSGVGGVAEVIRARAFMVRQFRLGCRSHGL